MGMTNFYQGSLRYDIHGRKRKTKALQKARSSNGQDTRFSSWQSGFDSPSGFHKSWQQKQSEEHRRKYPSMPMNNNYKPQTDESWKREASKSFTVAPAYNKGAYQVIPSSDVEHIGK